MSKFVTKRFESTYWTDRDWNVAGICLAIALLSACVLRMAADSPNVWPDYVPILAFIGCIGGLFGGICYACIRAREWVLLTLFLLVELIVFMSLWAA